MADCVTGSCLKHRVRVFLQGWGPDADRWCHLDGWPCEDIDLAVKATEPGSAPLTGRSG